MKAAPMLSFYGDDLTGSTDAMEALQQGGVRTVLFLSPASTMQLARFPGSQAVGLAGTSRSESPAWMDAHLPDAFGWLKSLQAPITHYKVCSTFDSAPHVGSIGRALDIGQKLFGQPVTPMMIGVPQLKRYTVFGHHFATLDGVTYPLDRHPVMRRHPMTPMDNADLRVLLARQTNKQVTLLDYVTLASEAADWAVDAAMRQQDSVLLFDVPDRAALRAIGAQLWRHRHPQRGLFVVGSSGVEYALVAEWRKQGLIRGTAPAEHAAPVGQIAVVSGSCSEITAGQILWAGRNGFDLIPINANRLLSPESAAQACESARATALESLRKRRSVVIHTSLGPDGDMEQAKGGQGIPMHSIGRRLGCLLRALVEQARLKRVVLAGGDTASHALRELEIFALTILSPLLTAPGAPLCTAHSDNPAFDKLQVALKGGQMGTERFFGAIRDGA